MGKRGPGAGQKMRVVEPTRKRPPNPHQGMSENAKTVWRRIVNSLSTDHFKPYQYDLLRSYCELANSNKNAIKMVDKLGEVLTSENGKMQRNPWLDVALQTSSQMSTLSAKLGINANSTLVDRRKIKPADTTPKSPRDGLLFGGNKK